MREFAGSFAPLANGNFFPGEESVAKLCLYGEGVEMSTSTELSTLGPTLLHDQAEIRESMLHAAGIRISRYGLVLVLLLIGVLKFTGEEAKGIQPLVANSPFMSWMYAILSVQSTSAVIGIIEIATAILIALRSVSAKASFAGSIGATLTFLVTVSFLFSTPGVAHLKYGFPVLGDAGQFLIKDVVLLGASLWTAAEAYIHIDSR